VIIHLTNNKIYEVELKGEQLGNPAGVWVTIPRTGAIWFIPYTSILYMKLERTRQVKKGDGG